MKRSRVVLLSLPSPFLANEQAYPPMGLLYLGAKLKRKHSVKIYQLTTDSYNDKLLLSGILEADYLGISTTTVQYQDALRWLRLIKSQAPNLHVAIGGPHATALPQECLTAGFDSVVVGEADVIVTDLVETLTKGITQAKPPHDLDTLPYADRDLLRGIQFHPFLFENQSDKMRIDPILLSRGCLYNCAFCSTSTNYRRRSIVNVLGEIELLQSRYRTQGLVILDDLPFTNTDQVRYFCNAIQPFGIYFRCNFRADLLNSDIIRMLYKARCCRIQIGVETADIKRLRQLKRGLAPEQIGEVIEMCQDFGIPVKAMFIWGLPGDNEKTADNIINWVQHYRPAFLQVSSYVPLPGTSLADQYESWWQNNDGCRPSFFGAEGQNEQESLLANDQLSGDDLARLKQRILKEVCSFTKVDLGKPYH